jgi:hypothetical protein
VSAEWTTTALGGERFLSSAVTTDAIERGIVVGIHWPAVLRN